MSIQRIEFGPEIYEKLATCPYCHRKNILSNHPKGNCEHYIVAFRDDAVYASVHCEGFRFNRRALTEALDNSGAHVTAFDKIGTRRHPGITVFYCENVDLVREVQQRHKKVPVRGYCDTCKGDEVVLHDDFDYPVCFDCGDRAEFPAWVTTPDDD